MNDAHAPHLQDVMQARLSRRRVLAGLAAGAGALALPAFARAESDAAAPSAFRFGAIPLAVRDDHRVAADHDAQVLIRWGDPVLPGAPAFDPNAVTGASQAKQFGFANDYTSYLPLPRGSKASTHGLLCVNHEFINARFLFPDETRWSSLDPARTHAEMAAHGHSVIEILRDEKGWRVVPDSRYARRITATTPIRLGGPAAGHHRMRTKDDPKGERVLGTLWNCAGGTTPWGTVLMAEENFERYFRCPTGAGGDEATNHARYGLAPDPGLAWWRSHERFDVRKEPREPNRFGWVVEFDPYDPGAMPVKRTALGRFKHEGATPIVMPDGRIVVYSGDDQAFEYLYRFVSDGRYDPTDRAANRDLLDAGTLYVARFEPSGRVHWLPLVFGTGPLTPRNGFHDTGDVLIETRRAATLLGATPLDRPEDVEVCPTTGAVYAVLTKNRDRTPSQVDGPNPRAFNAYGQILRIAPPRWQRGEPHPAAYPGDHGALRARWELFMLGGDPADGRPNNPDNAAFDPQGRFWIATDQGSAQITRDVADGLWACELSGPNRGRAKLFYACPRGAELCGPSFTPDGRTLFVAVQHPGQCRTKEGTLPTARSPATRWPDFDPDMPPRCSVVAITRKDDKPVGG